MASSVLYTSKDDVSIGEVNRSFELSAKLRYASLLGPEELSKYSFESPSDCNSSSDGERFGMLFDVIEGRETWASAGNEELGKLLSEFLSLTSSENVLLR